MSNLGKRAKEIFLDALDQSGNQEEFVTAACGDDAEFARESRICSMHTVRRVIFWPLQSRIKRPITVVGRQSK